MHTGDDRHYWRYTLNRQCPTGRVLVFSINALDRAEIERAIAAFARSSNGGLIVTVGGSGFHRDLIVPLAARHRLPAVYPYRYFVTDGA